MTVKNSKTKRKEDIKLLILEAARKLFLEQGFQATSVRKIAAEIGYSPTTIYLYYKDKNDIIYALHQEGFSLLRMKLTALAHVENPFERLKALGYSYLMFAKDYPDYYELMFMLKEPMQYLDNESEKEIWEGGRQVYAFIVSTIEECQEEGYFYSINPNEVALQAWSVVHGLCSLFLTTRLQKLVSDEPTPEESEGVLESVFKAYVDFVEQSKRLKNATNEN